MRHAAATDKNIVNGRLRQIKARAVLGIGMINSLLLFFYGGKRLFTGIQPRVHQYHAVNARFNGPPPHIFFPFPTQIGTAPKVKHIVVGAVAYPLSAAKDMLIEGVVEKALYKITAFFFVRMGRKERGNFFSVIF